MAGKKPTSKNNKAIASVRPLHSIALPAATLGFSSLSVPDTYDPEKPKFKANLHFSDVTVPMLTEIIETAVSPLEDKLKEEADFNLKERMPTEEWVKEKLKDPREDSPITTPYMTLACPSSYRDKEGNLVERTLPIWDRKNNLLNLKELRLGRGSIVEPIVTIGLFASKVMMGIPMPVVRLVGLRVVKLVRYSGGQVQAAALDDAAVRAAVGDDVDFDDDLSAYAASSIQSTAKAPTSEDEAAGDDLF